MRKLTVKNFGPIKDATIEVPRYVCLIGPQATGKSTLAKLVYFFLSLREVLTEELLNSPLRPSVSPFEGMGFGRRLKNHLYSFFGIPSVPAFSIRFDYTSDSWLEIAGDDRYELSIATSENLDPSLRRIAEELSRAHTERIAGITESGLSAVEGRRAWIRTQLDQVLDLGEEIVFIPAGRLWLSNASDPIGSIDLVLRDYPTRRFFEGVLHFRPDFRRSLSEVVRLRQAGSPEMESLLDGIRRILGGEYRYDEQGNQILLPDGETSVSLANASSGQQETVWMLLSLFALAVERNRALVFVEEPEAHLFPDTQKELVDLIIGVAVHTGGGVFLTTHSPYIVAALNNLLFAGDLRKKGKLPSSETNGSGPLLAIDPDDLKGYYVKGGTARSLIHPESGLLMVEDLDAVSASLNARYDELLDAELGGEHRND